MNIAVGTQTAVSNYRNLDSNLKCCPRKRYRTVHVTTENRFRSPHAVIANANASVRFGAPRLICTQKPCCTFLEVSSSRAFSEPKSFTIPTVRRAMERLNASAACVGDLEQEPQKGAPSLHEYVSAEGYCRDFESAVTCRRRIDSHPHRLTSVMRTPRSTLCASR